jgi:hypothetical protein
MKAIKSTSIKHIFIYLFTNLWVLGISCEKTIAASINQPTWTEGANAVEFTTTGDYPTAQHDSVTRSPSATHTEYLGDINFTGSVDAYIKEKACCLVDNLSGARSVYSKNSDVNLTISNVACHKTFPAWSNRIYRPATQMQEIAEWDAWMGRLDWHETCHHLSLLAFMKQGNIDIYLNAQDFSKGSESTCTRADQVEAAKDVVARQLQAELAAFRNALSSARANDVISDHNVIGYTTVALPIIN